MKYKLILFLAFFSVSSWLHSTTWEIKQDGTGDFSSIQAGIDASANSDTILVYPGIFYENINTNGNSVTIGSLFLTTGEEHYIDQTIIDGNHESHCVTISYSNNAVIIGFTIKNGLACTENYSGQYGGGMKIIYSQQVFISHCIISNNKAYYGGGIYLYQSNVILKRNTICYNWAVYCGGGVEIAGTGSTLTFDPSFLNNIYLNYSATGSDLAAINTSLQTEIIVDTFTVEYPDNFYIASSESFIVNLLHSKIEQIDHDLFVSPDGCNTNNGLLPSDPLQSIYLAQILIKGNDENPNIIFLDSGVYSELLNNQKFPLNIKQGIILRGNSQEDTIIDGENQAQFIWQEPLDNVYSVLKLQNLSLINGHAPTYISSGAISIMEGADVYLDSITISNCYGDIGSAIFCKDGYYEIKNSEFKDNTGGFSIYLGPDYNNPSPFINVYLENVIVKNNYPGIGNEEGSGGGIKLSGHEDITGNYFAKLVDCEISSNYNELNSSVSGLYTIDIEVDIFNCTIGDNLSNNGYCVAIVSNSDVLIYNTIIYNNVGCELYVGDNCNVLISNSLVESGINEILIHANGCLTWQTPNLNLNPLWLGTGNYPYYLQSTSPCIDAGTLNLPAGIELPEFDLAGNPRIYGDTIDMGAYEWQGTGVSDELEVVSSKLSNFPNPFNPSTTIKLELTEAGKIELAIYNIKGQKVKTLMDCTTIPGTYECNWNGKDESGKSVSSGQYIVKLKQNEKETAKKIMMLK